MGTPARCRWWWGGDIAIYSGNTPVVANATILSFDDQDYIINDEGDGEVFVESSIQSFRIGPFDGDEPSPIAVSLPREEDGGYIVQITFESTAPASLPSGYCAGNLTGSGFDFCFQGSLPNGAYAMFTVSRRSGE